MEMTEKRFESDIEAAFLSPTGGYIKGTDTYDPKQGLYVATLIDFIQTTQPKEYTPGRFFGRQPSPKKPVFSRLFSLFTVLRSQGFHS